MKKFGVGIIGGAGGVGRAHIQCCKLVQGVEVSNHPEVLKFGYRSFNDVKNLIKDKKITDLTAAAHLVHVGRVIKEKATGILVSSGISKTYAERLGFIHTNNFQDALNKAVEIKGKKATSIVVKQGGEILPV